MIYINMYLSDRQYGGPEEGGWWYDTLEPVLAIKIFDDEWKEDMIKNMQSICDSINEGKPDTSSVTSVGRYICSVEDHEAVASPVERQCYE